MTTEPSRSESSIGASMSRIPPPCFACACPVACPDPNCFFAIAPMTMAAATGSIFFRMSAPMPVCEEARCATERLTSLLPKMWPRIPFPSATVSERPSVPRSSTYCVCRPLPSAPSNPSSPEGLVASRLKPAARDGSKAVSAEDACEGSSPN